MTKEKAPWEARWQAPWEFIGGFFGVLLNLKHARTIVCWEAVGGPMSLHPRPKPFKESARPNTRKFRPHRFECSGYNFWGKGFAICKVPEKEGARVWRNCNPIPTTLKAGLWELWTVGVVSITVEKDQKKTSHHQHFGEQSRSCGGRLFAIALRFQFARPFREEVCESGGWPVEWH